MFHKKNVASSLKNVVQIFVFVVQNVYLCTTSNNKKYGKDNYL